LLLRRTCWRLLCRPALRRLLVAGLRILRLRGLLGCGQFSIPLPFPAVDHVSH
jgi:hypothetical protein